MNKLFLRSVFDIREDCCDFVEIERVMVRVPTVNSHFKSKWKLKSGIWTSIFHRFFIFHRRWKMESGCSYSTFQFSFRLEMRINGRYTDRLLTPVSLFRDYSRFLVRLGVLEWGSFRLGQRRGCAVKQFREYPDTLSNFCRWFCENPMSGWECWTVGGSNPRGFTTFSPPPLVGHFKHCD